MTLFLWGEKWETEEMFDTICHILTSLVVCSLCFWVIVESFKLSVDTMLNDSGPPVQSPP